MIDSVKEKRFFDAKIRLLSESGADGGIGRLAEKSLHKVLKSYIEPDETFHEREHLGSVADVMNNDGIYEIQTRSAERLIPKLERFLETSHVTVVVPVIAERLLFKFDKSTGEISEPRKSPKKETPYTAFREIYKIRKFLPHENLSIRLITLKAEEYKHINAHRGKRKIDVIPTHLIDDEIFDSPLDYMRFLPDSLPDEFTAKEHSLLAKYPASLSSYVLGVLHLAGAVQLVGREGRANLYKIKHI